MKQPDEPTRSTRRDFVRRASGLAAGALAATNTVTGVTRRRYGASSPGRDDEGATQELVLYAGQGVDAIRDVPSAGDLVARLWKECLAARP